METRDMQRDDMEIWLGDLAIDAEAQVRFEEAMRGFGLLGQMEVYDWDQIALMEDSLLHTRLPLAWL